MNDRPLVYQTVRLLEKISVLLQKTSLAENRLQKDSLRSDELPTQKTNQFWWINPWSSWEIAPPLGGFDSPLVIQSSLEQCQGNIWQRTVKKKVALEAVVA